MARKPNVYEFYTISLAEIGAKFMKISEECVKWLKEIGLLAAHSVPEVVKEVKKMSNKNSIYYLSTWSEVSKMVSQ